MIIRRLSIHLTQHITAVTKWLWHGWILQYFCMVLSTKLMWTITLLVEKLMISKAQSRKLLLFCNRCSSFPQTVHIYLAWRREIMYKTVKCQKPMVLFDLFSSVFTWNISIQYTPYNIFCGINYHDPPTHCCYLLLLLSIV